MSAIENLIAYCKRNPANARNLEAGAIAAETEFASLRAEIAEAVVLLRGAMQFMEHDDGCKTRHPRKRDEYPECNCGVIDAERNATMFLSKHTTQEKAEGFVSAAAEKQELAEYREALDDAHTALIQALGELQVWGEARGLVLRNVAYVLEKLAKYTKENT